MKIVRLLRPSLKTVSVPIFGGSLFFGWLFYLFYLKWFFLFENGRYFDPVEEVVYEEDSLILGIISLFLLVISVALWLIASKLKAKPKAQPAAPPPLQSSPS